MGPTARRSVRAPRGILSRASLIAALTSACPATRPPLRPEPRLGRAEVARFVIPVGDAQRDGSGEDVSFRGDGAVLRGARVVLRIGADAIVDPQGRPLARLGRDGSLSRADGTAWITLDGDALRRSGGEHVVVRDDGRVVVRNARGEEVSAPWTLRVEAQSAMTAAAALLVLDGLDAATSSAAHEGSPQ